MSFTVDFERVGRGEVSWHESFDHRPTEIDLVRSVKAKRVLASKGIDVGFCEDNRGSIFAGLRAVGTFSIREVRA